MGLIITWSRHTSDSDALKGGRTPTCTARVRLMARCPVWHRNQGAPLKKMPVFQGGRAQLHSADPLGVHHHCNVRRHAGAPRHAGLAARARGGHVHGRCAPRPNPPCLGCNVASVAPPLLRHGLRTQMLLLRRRRVGQRNGQSSRNMSGCNGAHFPWSAGHTLWTPVRENTAAPLKGSGRDFELRTKILNQKP